LRSSTTSSTVPTNTWNYPSPGSPRLQYSPVSRASSPIVPWSPTIASSPELRFEFVIPGFPFLTPTGPGPYDVYIPQSPQYSTLSASAGIALVDPDTLEPTPIDPNPYVVCSPSPLTPAPTLEALRTTAKFDLEQLGEETANHVSLEDIPLENLPPPIVTTPAAALASPALPSPAPTPHSHHRPTELHVTRA